MNGPGGYRHMARQKEVGRLFLEDSAEVHSCLGAGDQDGPWWSKRGINSD